MSLQDRVLDLETVRLEFIKLNEYSKRTLVFMLWFRKLEVFKSPEVVKVRSSWLSAGFNVAA